jgi:hypothetical protein
LFEDGGAGVPLTSLGGDRVASAEGELRQRQATASDARHVAIDIDPVCLQLLVKVVAEMFRLDVGNLGLSLLGALLISKREMGDIRKRQT